MDSRFAVTADTGDKPLLIIWDLKPETDSVESDEIAAFPIKTIFDCHSSAGAAAVRFTADSKYMITLGADNPQTLSVWSWTTSSTPIVTLNLVGEPQHCIDLNSHCKYEFMTTGSNSVSFYFFDESLQTIVQTPALIDTG
jgi:hypothetical protein